MRGVLLGSLAVLVAVLDVPTVAGKSAALQEYPVPVGSHPHDVAPAPDGTVWYTAQFTGELGRLDPATGTTRHIKLGQGSRPHGVIVGPDGAPWITDGGLNAIVRVDPKTDNVQVFPLPKGREGANLNTATFDARGVLWFTGQSGVYGRLDPASGRMRVFDAPDGAGPYGIIVARRQLRRADRPRDGRGPRVATSDSGPGRPPRLGGLARANLGQRVECRQA